MKTRYKFDECWKEALRRLGDSAGHVEAQIRRYLEEGTEPDIADLNYYYEGFVAVWVLIKAQIDARKERNARARERRRMRRDAILEAEEAKKRRREAEDARKAEAEQAEKQRIADERKARRREERLRKVAPRRDSISSSPAMTKPAPSPTPTFASRFRGPGIATPRVAAIR
ncbi:hypothetical protein [Muribaculum intestinale]|uniref:hypothetical protein n=1 Tax=Muribaculum intestinale TaxID=1796646 RepID=UPI0025A991E8|nr:hypothetical protein [Muribaculum intestinale]